MMNALRAWWGSISPREQRLVGIGGVSLLVGLLYWGVWQPLADRVAERERQVAAQQRTLGWLKEKGEMVLALQAVTGRQVDTGGTLEGVINRTASNHKITIARLQPQGQDLQVWIDTIPFDSLLLWIAELTDRYGIQVQVIEIARENQPPGMVKVRRLQLSRPL
ncbi:GspM family type II secretion system protein ExeM [Aeromonas simiae]|uniref:GspM family type II secretion system protein ExeM n=1 Tax=Aeromonas simiae TaxID=218936 RepID=UPI0005A7D141|nr:GspM family type II secretion system protein ExeM [Aeromonas simiae]